MSVTIIEVAFIVTAIATNTGSSPVARDAVFAVVMIMLNGTIGLCLLLGGLRHHEQTYNLPGARAFLSVVIPLAVFALILPNFTAVAPGPVLSTPQAISIAISRWRCTPSSSRCRQCGIEASSRTRSRRQQRAAEAPTDGRACRRASVRVSRRVPRADIAAGRLSHRGTRPHRRTCRDGDERAARSGRRHRRRAGAGSRGDGRIAGHLAKSTAARRQYLAWIGACDDRPDHPGGAYARRVERHAHHPRPGSGSTWCCSPSPSSFRR